jgi:hypothetical protein
VQLKEQFSLNTLGPVGQLLQQIYRCHEILDRIEIRGALDRLLARAAEIFECLIDVIAVTEVMRQLN